MQINLAHLKARATSGGYISFAVFDARSRSGCDSENATFLSQLRAKTINSGLRVDQAALAFNQNGRTRFYGDSNLVAHLSESGVPAWTHKIEV